MRPAIVFRRTTKLDSLWLTEFYYKIEAGNNDIDTM